MNPIEASAPKRTLPPAPGVSVDSYARHGRIPHRPRRTAAIMVLNMERVFKDQSSSERSSSRAPLKPAANQPQCRGPDATGLPDGKSARTESEELSRVLGGIGAPDQGALGPRLAALLRQLRVDMQGLDEEE